MRRVSVRQRQGQVNMSCAQCHNDFGKRLAGNTIPQAQPTGYPVYRLGWQEIGSLQCRLRNCLLECVPSYIRTRPRRFAHDLGNVATQKYGCSLVMQLTAQHQAPSDIGSLQCRAFGR